MKIEPTHTVTSDTGEIVPAIASEVWRHEFEQQDANRRIHRRGWENNPECKMCGRKMSDSALKKARSVHMTVYLDLVPVSANIVNDSQGFFQVGSECAKRLPKDFVTKAGG